MELNIEGLTEEDAKLAIDIARKIAARSFARGFKSRCPICGTKDGDHVDEVEQPEADNAE